METDLTPAETAASTESAHTTSRKSAPTLRMDLIPRGERRRRWTTEQKQTIAAQSLAPGASPTEVARLHGISTGQLYTWRHALKAAQPSAAIGRSAELAENGHRVFTICADLQQDGQIARVTELAL